MDGIDRDIAKELKTIKDMIQDSKKSLNDFTDMRDDKNESDIGDAQNATCELSEDVESRLSDIENALCELTEE